MLNTIVQCDKCKHFSREFYYPTCKAFPDGIPIEIYSDSVIHTKAYEGDNGIQFEAIESKK